MLRYFLSAFKHFKKAASLGTTRGPRKQSRGLGRVTWAYPWPKGNTDFKYCVVTDEIPPTACAGTYGVWLIITIDWGAQKLKKWSRIPVREIFRKHDKSTALVSSSSNSNCFKGVVLFYLYCTGRSHVAERQRCVASAV